MFLCPHPRCRLPTSNQRCPGGHPALPIPGLEGWKAGDLKGEGGFAKVYACYEGDFRRAIKIVDPAKATDPQSLRDAFRRECRALAELTHAHVIALINAQEVGGLLCLITEYVPGTLAEVLEPGQPLALPRALHFAAQLADALAYIHDRGISHRDIKPKNIGLDRDDHLRLFDFGLSGVHRADSSTSVGIHGFSRPYAAPEQLLPEKYGAAGPASDRYSFGALLYELITGQTHRPRGVELGYEVYVQQPIPPLPADPQRPPALDKLIFSCLKVHPDHRPPDTWGLQDVLADLADRLGAGHGEAHARYVEIEGQLGQKEKQIKELELWRAALIAETSDLTKVRPTAAERESARSDLSAIQRRTTAAQEALQALEGKVEVARRVRLRRWGLPVAALGIGLVLGWLLAPTPEQTREPIASARTLPPAPPTEAPATEPPRAVEAPKTTPAAPGNVIAAPSSERPALYFIPAGTFMMGSPESDKERDNNDTEQAVELTRSYLMFETEVTQAQWEAVMSTKPAHFSACGAACPVEQVSWWDALAYANELSKKEELSACYKLSSCKGKVGDMNFTCSAPKRIAGCTGYRLPTEAEWEYAARAGTTEPRPGKPDTVAWYNANAEGKTHPVGQKAANAWGLQDMLGNVWEWCEEGLGDGRVVRGGSWVSSVREVRSAVRLSEHPAGRRHDVGFRLVRAPNP